jgi:hypothetical protein
VRVDVDRKPVTAPALSESGRYYDLVIPIPRDPSRPPVSEITLHFDSGDRDSFVFKLDRLTIR